MSIQFQDDFQFAPEHDNNPDLVDTDIDLQFLGCSFEGLYSKINNQHAIQRSMDDAVQAAADPDALKWINEKAGIEASRLRELGVKPLLLQPRNCGIVREQNHSPPLIINRIEIATNFDFSARVKQIMVSDPMRYTPKDDFLYVNVLFMTENVEMPLLVPYIYKGTLDKRRTDIEHNNLKEWLIVNAVGSRARLSTPEFHKV